MSNMVKRIKCINRRELLKKTISEYFEIAGVTLAMVIITIVLFYFIYGV